MALRPRTTGVTSTSVQISTNTPTGRTPNLLAIQVVNPSGVSVLLDIQDGPGGTVLDTIAVGPYSQSVKEWAPSQGLGNTSFTAGNAIYAQTRAAVSGGVEVICEHGRV